MPRPDSTGASRDDAPPPRGAFDRLHVAHPLLPDASGRLGVESDPRLARLYGPAATAEAEGLWAALGIRCSVMVTSGSRSAQLSDELVEPMAAPVPELTVMRTDSGQFILRDAPPEFIELVEDFVRAAEPKHLVDG